MNLRILAVALALWPSAAWANWAVPTRVAVSSGQLTLSDLVSGAPASWSSVALGQAPLPGGQRILNRDWVLQRAREVGAQGSIDMPDVVTVTRPGQPVERNEVVKAVEQTLSRRLRPGDTMKVVAVGPTNMVPKGVLRLVTAVPEGELSGAFTVWVDVLTNGRKADQTWARVEVSRSHPVVVLTRSLRRGAILGPADLERRLVGGAPRSRPVLADPADAVGKRLVRSLPAGAPVSADDVEVQPAVKKGDLVHLVARAGSVVATTIGRALGPAQVGQALRVENVGSGRIVQGVLRMAGVVDVSPNFAGGGR